MQSLINDFCTVKSVTFLNKLAWLSKPILLSVMASFAMKSMNGNGLGWILSGISWLYKNIL